jgi:hypothetical protein
LLLAVAAACPLLLHAQFQEPTAEELKMTADPKAPGAAAVYLNYEDVTDCGPQVGQFDDRATRQQIVDMHYAEQINDQVVYHQYSGLTLETLPQDAKIPWEGHAALVEKLKADPGKITVARSLARAFTIAKPEEYSALRDFYQKVAAADQQQLSLTTTPAPAKGN